MNRTVARDVVHTAVLILATARLIQFVIGDSLGHWWVVAPVRRWANRHDTVTGDLDAEPDPENGWRSKVASGVDCPFCVGFHIGWVLLLGDRITRTRAFSWTRPVWTLVLGALALNEVVVTARIRDWVI